MCFLLSLFAGSNLPLPLGGAGAHASDVGAPLVGAHAYEQGGHKGRPYDESDEEDDIEEPLGDAQPAQEAGQEGGPFVATEPADELRYKQLVLLLADEVAAVEQEFEYEEKLNEEKTAIERDACLAPSGEEWRMLLRREESLDRAIDRKIKLLLTLRKSGTGTPACAGVSPAEGLETGKSACPTPQETEARSTGTPARAEESTAAALDVGAPAEDLGAPGPIEEEAPAVSSAGA